MRARMKIVRDKHDHKLLKDAWAQWKRAFHLRYTDQYFAQKLVLRFFKKWRLKLSQLDGLENRGDHLVVVREQRQAVVCWELWKGAVGLRRAESALAESVNLRILSASFETWKQRM